MKATSPGSGSPIPVACQGRQGRGAGEGNIARLWSPIQTHYIPATASGSKQLGRAPAEQQFEPQIVYDDDPTSVEL